MKQQHSGVITTPRLAIENVQALNIYRLIRGHGITRLLCVPVATYVLGGQGVDAKPYTSGEEDESFQWNLWTNR